MTATPEAVRELRRVVGTFAADLGVLDPPLADVKLAVSEAVTNVVVHSYRAQDVPGPVGVHAEHGPHELCIVVRDQGQGCTARADSLGAVLGIGLMSRVADRVEIRSASPRGTEVHLCFPLTPDHHALPLHAWKVAGARPAVPVVRGHRALPGGQVRLAPPLIGQQADSTARIRRHPR